MEGLWIGASLAGITILGNIAVTIVSKYFDYKKKIKSNVLESAYKEWELKTKLLNEQAVKTNTVIPLVPFADYVLYYSIYNKRLLKKNVTTKDIEKFFEEKDKLYKKFNELREKEKKGYSESN